jgi:hypothetical protein
MLDHLDDGRASLDGCPSLSRNHERDQGGDGRLIEKIRAAKDDPGIDFRRAEAKFNVQTAQKADPWDSDFPSDRALRTTRIAHALADSSR